MIVVASFVSGVVLSFDQLCALLASARVSGGGGSAQRGFPAIHRLHRGRRHRSRTGRDLDRARFGLTPNFFLNSGSYLFVICAHPCTSLPVRREPGNPKPHRCCGSPFKRVWKQFGGIPN